MDEQTDDMAISWVNSENKLAKELAGWPSVIPGNIEGPMILNGKCIGEMSLPKDLDYTSMEVYTQGKVNAVFVRKEIVSGGHVRCVYCGETHRKD